MPILFGLPVWKLAMLPTLFISHGSPMLAVEPSVYGEAWRHIAAELPRPSAILAVSAHWNTRQPALSLVSPPQTLHDFGGFPPELYRIQYPAPGAPTLARRAAELLEQAGIAVELAPERGLDHGAWVPLRQMYPAADIPVTQLSVQPMLNARWHYLLGEALRPLRDDNVLILASGSVTHNLYEVHFDERNPDRADAYVRRFQEWLFTTLTRQDRDALLDWHRLAPEARRVHPSPEHLLPLFVAYGAAGDITGNGESGNGEGVRLQRPLSNYSVGALAMDCYIFG
jgi:4,5-DOPA dioxygenase extradiol